ncbi:MAG TPA: hypothetical protein VK817_24435 [Trebonia sp.]|nr:hypothetical protein [Trebonia sp.]
MQEAEGLAAKAAQAIATRDAIQANLLDLDGSYGKRLLDGARLRGVSKEKWDAAAARLADLWQTFTAYSAVIDRLAELTQARRPKAETPELIRLLSGRCVTLTQAPAPLARRDLADTGRRDLTLTAAVAAMRSAFSDVTDVTSAAEAAWNDTGSRLDAVAAQLTGARQRFAGIDDQRLTAEVAAAQERLDAYRADLNSDPLALDASGVGALGELAATIAAEAAKLDQLRREARDRIGQLRAQADELAAARRDAVTAWQRASVRVAGVPPLPAETPPPPLDRLDALAGAGQWRQLSETIDKCASALTVALSQTRDTSRSMVSFIDQRDELRGLLDAYKVKAARLGSAEDEGLTARYDRARALLWTAPCDLAAAADAVTGYQQAILALEGQRR